VHLATCQSSQALTALSSSFRLSLRQGASTWRLVQNLMPRTDLASRQQSWQARQRGSAQGQVRVVHTHAGAGRLSASTSINFCHRTCVLTLTAYRPAVLAHIVLQTHSLARHSEFSAAPRDSQVACIGPCAEPGKRHGPALGALTMPGMLPGDVSVTCAVLMSAAVLTCAVSAN